MIAKRVHTCLYVSHSKQSTTFLKCKYDKETWKKIWNCTKEIYDKIDVLKLKTLNENMAEVRECLKSYVNDQVTFICELPSFIGKDMCSANEPVKNPYRKQSIVEMNQFSKEQIQSDISELCVKQLILQRSLLN